ncbi:autotransporter outer membrane beta-barrel domain-containing protein [Helicobacter mustelae]|uniref:autotransporter outer membrane beta-barrel domain-containing protein n=1 Tax=Helicobacter mustelae TaxID=217 RepID=UPI000E0EE250|nr:autotransporter outer membrane beta-barrel domain-containing protein [Helicobacter mustelae]
MAFTLQTALAQTDTAPNNAPITIDSNKKEIPETINITTANQTAIEFKPTSATTNPITAHLKQNTSTVTVTSSVTTGTNTGIGLASDAQSDVGLIITGKNNTTSGGGSGTATTSSTSDGSILFKGFKAGDKIINFTGGKLTFDKVSIAVESNSTDNTKMTTSTGATPSISYGIYNGGNGPTASSGGSGSSGENGFIYNFGTTTFTNIQGKEGRTGGGSVTHNSGTATTPHSQNGESGGSAIGVWMANNATFSGVLKFANIQGGNAGAAINGGKGGNGGNAIGIQGNDTSNVALHFGNGTASSDGGTKQTSTANQIIFEKLIAGNGGAGNTGTSGDGGNAIGIFLGEQSKGITLAGRGQILFGHMEQGVTSAGAETGKNGGVYIIKNDSTTTASSGAGGGAPTPVNSNVGGGNLTIEDGAQIVVGSMPTGSTNANTYTGIVVNTTDPSFVSQFQFGSKNSTLVIRTKESGSLVGMNITQGAVQAQGNFLAGGAPNTTESVENTVVSGISIHSGGALFSDRAGSNDNILYVFADGFLGKVGSSVKDGSTGIGGGGGSAVGIALKGGTLGSGKFDLIVKGGDGGNGGSGQMGGRGGNATAISNEGNSKIINSNIQVGTLEAGQGGKTGNGSDGSASGARTGSSGAAYVLQNLSGTLTMQNSTITVGVKPIPGFEAIIQDEMGKYIYDFGSGSAKTIASFSSSDLSSGGSDSASSTKAPANPSLAGVLLGTGKTTFQGNAEFTVTNTKGVAVGILGVATPPSAPTASKPTPAPAPQTQPSDQGPTGSSGSTGVQSGEAGRSDATSGQTAQTTQGSQDSTTTTLAQTERVAPPAALIPNTSTTLVLGGENETIPTQLTFNLSGEKSDSGAGNAAGNSDGATPFYSYGVLVKENHTLNLAGRGTIVFTSLGSNGAVIAVGVGGNDVTSSNGATKDPSTNGGGSLIIKEGVRIIAGSAGPSVKDGNPVIYSNLSGANYQFGNGNNNTVILANGGASSKLVGLGVAQSADISGNLEVRNAASNSNGSGSFTGISLAGAKAELNVVGATAITVSGNPTVSVVQGGGAQSTRAVVLAGAGQTSNINVVGIRGGGNITLNDNLALLLIGNTARGIDPDGGALKLSAGPASTTGAKTGSTDVRQLIIHATSTKAGSAGPVIVDGSVGTLIVGKNVSIVGSSNTSAVSFSTTAGNGKDSSGSTGSNNTQASLYGNVANAQFKLGNTILDSNNYGIYAAQNTNISLAANTTLNITAQQAFGAANNANLNVALVNRSVIEIHGQGGTINTLSSDKDTYGAVVSLAGNKQERSINTTFRTLTIKNITANHVDFKVMGTTKDLGTGENNAFASIEDIGKTTTAAGTGKTQGSTSTVVAGGSDRIIIEGANQNSTASTPKNGASDTTKATDGGNGFQRISVTQPGSFSVSGALATPAPSATQTSANVLNETLSIGFINANSSSKSPQYAVLAEVKNGAANSVIFNGLNKQGDTTKITSIQGFDQGIFTLGRKDVNGNAYYYTNLADRTISLMAGARDATLAALASGYQLYLANINSLNKRLGELRNNPNANGLWIRLFNGEQVTRFAVDSKSLYTTLQGGYDYAFGSEGANNYLGFAISYANAITSTKNFVFENQVFGLKDGNSNALEIALYNSYVQDGASKDTKWLNGFYSDSVIKLSIISTSLQMQGQNNKYNTNNAAFTFSEEIGYRFLLGENNEWYITPQGEVALGYFNSNQFTQALNNNTLFGKQEAIITVRTRAGASFGYKFDKFTEGKGFKSEIYLGTFYRGTYISGGQVNLVSAYSATTLTPFVSGNGFLLNLGTNFLIKDHHRVYIDLERSFGGSFITNYQFNVGYRYSFGENKKYKPRIGVQTPNSIKKDESST